MQTFLLLLKKPRFSKYLIAFLTLASLGFPLSSFAKPETWLLEFGEQRRVEALGLGALEKMDNCKSSAEKSTLAQVEIESNARAACQESHPSQQIESVKYRLILD